MNDNDAGAGAGADAPAITEHLYKEQTVAFLRKELKEQGRDASAGYKAELLGRLPESKFSVVGKRKREELEAAAETQKALAEMLEGPICEDEIMKPIHQCKNGHTFCGSCKTKFPTENCPTCKCSIKAQYLGRNLKLEQAAEHIKLPCKHGDAGCEAVVVYPNYHAHVAYCDYRPFACPLNLYGAATCDWTGKVGEVHDHMKEEHDLGNVFSKGGWAIKDQTTACAIHKGYKRNDEPLDNELFFLIFHGGPGHTHVTVHHIGQKTWSAGWYNVTFGMEGQGKRLIRWTFPVVSIRTTHDDAVASGKCFSIPTSSLKHFNLIEDKKAEDSEKYKDNHSYHKVDVVNIMRNF